MADQDGLFLFATIRPKLEHFDQAKQALIDLVPPTLAEPGCHVFDVFESRSEEAVLHLFEHFTDEAALEAHYAQPHTIEVFEHYQDWLNAPVEVVKLAAPS